MMILIYLFFLFLCFLKFQSEELKSRLRKLAEMAERNAYEELVKDITPKKTDDEPFSSYKDQLGFGNIFVSALKKNKKLYYNGIHSFNQCV